MALPVLLGCAVSLTLCGCAALTGREMVVGPSYEPRNVSSQNAELPEEFRRVAVLPLVGGEFETRRSMEQVYLSELSQARRFEVIQVSRDELKSWTGRDNWTTADTLPLDLLSRVRSRYACDGVLFAELTQVQVYAPLRIGWRFTLVDATEGRALWAADEVFDSTDEAVANGARRFQLGSQGPRNAAPDSRFILLSPTVFGRYSARTLLTTLPQPNAAKFLPVPADSPSIVRSSQ
jgi:hypothetical protein